MYITNILVFFMDKKYDFKQGKKNALKKLELAKKDDKVDSKIIPIIDFINRSDLFYTTSSCAGRLIVLQLPVVGDKKNAVFLGKWHRKIKTNEVIDAIDNAEKGEIWFLAQSSIIHIVCYTESAADKMLKLGVSCGFKNSGLKALRNKIIVEVCSTERMDVPLGIDKKIYCDNKYIDLIVDIGNEIIDKSDSKLNRFSKKVKENI